MFLHHTLQQHENSLFHRFVMAQMHHPVNTDWVSTVLEDMEDLEIDLELEDVKHMTKTKFKEYVYKKVRGPAFLYLMNKKIPRNSDRAKGKYLDYNELDMAKYLTLIDYEISIDEKSGYNSAE